jgi:hypothetical protein
VGETFDSLPSMGEEGVYLRQQYQLKPLTKKKKQLKNSPLTEVFHTNLLRSLQDTLYGIETYEGD